MRLSILIPAAALTLVLVACGGGGSGAQPAAKAPEPAKPASGGAAADPTKPSAASAPAPAATALAQPKPTGAVPTTSATGVNVKKEYSSPPPMTVDPKKKYVTAIQTNMGTVTAELYPEDAPKTVNNFVFLAREGYYDGVPFHRIVKGFMAQTGDPTGSGAGGPGYTFEDEPVKRNYVKGTLAMANRGPNTNGSQFFIVFRDYNLPKQYTIFGKVTSGDDTLQKLEEVPVKPNRGGEPSQPTVEVKIEKVTIQEQ